jgi:hypothetical protein
MKKFLFLIAVFCLVSCGKERLRIIHNDDRVSDLERRMTLVEKINSAQSTLIQMNHDSIISLTDRVSTNESNIANLEISLNNLQEDMIEADQHLTDMIIAASEASADGDEENAAALLQAIQQQQIINQQIKNNLIALNAAALAQVFTNIVLQAQISSNSSQISSLMDDLSDLSARVSLAESNVESLESQMDVVISDIDSLKTRTTNIENGLSNLTSRMTLAENNITGLRTDVNYLLANQVEIVDPCPNVANSEILLRVQGKLVAFYQGDEGFLSIIGNGNYRTTDPQQCTFTVLNDQIVSSAPAITVPSGATHELLLCGIKSYKVSGGVVVNGTTYTSNTTLSLPSGNCTITNPQSNSVSSNGGSGLGSAQSCNYNGIPSVTSMTPIYNTGASSSSCYIKKL